MSSYQKRRISEQTYKFPKCIFSIFFLNTRYIFILCTMSFSWSSACCWSIKFFLKMLCAERGGVGGWKRRWCERSREEKKRKGKWKGADWEKLRKINMWVIRKHKYWMFRVCECLAFCTSTELYFIRLCQSWRIYGELLMYSIHGKSESKMKEFSHRWRENLIENFP